MDSCIHRLCSNLPTFVYKNTADMKQILIVYNFYKNHVSPLGVFRTDGWTDILNYRVASPQKIDELNELRHIVLKIILRYSKLHSRVVMILKSIDFVCSAIWVHKVFNSKFYIFFLLCFFNIKKS